MPRRQRIHVPGGTYYVVRRTHLSSPVFAERGDYALIASLLPAALKRTGAQLLGYCWVPDAIHLALQIDSTPVGDFMRELASRYARRLQLRSGERGQFFRRPYQSTLIDADSYLPGLIRYMHYIPVLEGIAQQAGDYAHTSHRAYLGDAPCAWLNTKPLLQLLDSCDPDRVAYRRLLAQAPTAADRVLFERGHADNPGVLGSAEFFGNLPRRGRAARSSRSLDEIVAYVARVHGVRQELLLSRSRRRDLVLARAQIAWYATERRIATLGEVARYFRRTASSLTRAMARHQVHEPELFTFDAFTSIVPLVPQISDDRLEPGQRYAPGRDTHVKEISRYDSRALTRA